MMRISQGLACLALAALAGAVVAETASAQSQRSGIEQTPLAPPSGFGAPTAPEPRRVTPPPPAPTAQAPATMVIGAGTAAPAPAPGAAADADGDGVVVQLSSVKIPNRLAVFAGLDKITGRITSFDVAIGETAQFGALQVTPRVCYTRPATETQNTTAFAEVNEVTLKGEAKRIFTGWMFAASPGLHAVEHPIYDVWLIGCKAPAPVTAAGQQ